MQGDNNDTETKIEKRELAPGVILYKEYKNIENNPDIIGIFIWKVELTTMSVVDFEVHLDQSENIGCLLYVKHYLSCQTSFICLTNKTPYTYKAYFPVRTIKKK